MTSPMKNNEKGIDQQWEDYRDDVLSPAKRQAFESYLETNPDQAALYQAETQWLNTLKYQEVQTAHNGEQTASQIATSLSERVLHQWDSEPEKTGVLARINLKASLFIATWATAAALIAFSMWVHQTPLVNEPTQEQLFAQQTIPQTIQTQQISSDNSSVALASHQEHPLTVILDDMNRQYVAQPTQIIRALDQAPSWASLSNFAMHIELVSSEE